MIERNWFWLLICPVVILTIVVLVCKYKNFSILPKGLRGRKPKKYSSFRMPVIRRDSEGRWAAEKMVESDEESSSMEYSSSDDDLSEYSSSDDDDFF